MANDDSFGALGSNLKISANADQVEAMAIGQRGSSIVRSLLDERISGETDDDAKGDRIEGDTVPAEELAGATLEQIQLRSDLLQDAYPFTIEGQTLRYKGDGSGVYEFCLQLSRMDHAENQNAPDIILFELLSAKLIGDLMGGQSYRTGWPTHNKSERPERLAQVAQILHEKSGEWWWRPMFGNVQDPDPKIAKDEGLDFVVWRRLDARPGSLFIAGQCACGKNWRNKFNDLTQDGIARWWPRPSHVQFTRALSIPYVIPGRNVIGDVSREAGLVFDRIRLALAGKAARSSDAWSEWFREQRIVVDAR